MSITSTLIQASLSNVQKEFKQLEHWLNSLHSTSTTSPTDSNLESAIRELSTKIDTLSKQYNVQQLALNHIVDRLDILERGRDIQIDDQSPWLNTDGLENSIIEPEESVYVIHKEDDIIHIDSPVISTTVPPVSPMISALNTAFYVEPATPAPPPVEVSPVELAQPAQPIVEAIRRDEDDEIEEETEEEQVQEEKEQVQEEEEEEEEEDGVELSEITFKDKTYYKDGENFVYGIDDEGQPTDQPIGIWKEKTQSVAFYRLK